MGKTHTFGPLGTSRALFEQWVNGALCDQAQYTPESHGRGANSSLSEGEEKGDDEEKLKIVVLATSTRLYLEMLRTR